MPKTSGIKQSRRKGGGGRKQKLSVETKRHNDPVAKRVEHDDDDSSEVAIEDAKMMLHKLLSQHGLQKELMQYQHAAVVVLKDPTTTYDNLKDRLLNASVRAKPPTDPKRAKRRMNDPGPPEAFTFDKKNPYDAAYGPTLQERFREARTTMEEKDKLNLRIPDREEEALLKYIDAEWQSWHVTSEESVDSIFSTGLDKRFGGNDKGISQLCSVDEQARQRNVKGSRGYNFITRSRSEAKQYAKSLKNKGVKPFTLDVFVPSTHYDRLEVDPDSKRGLKTKMPLKHIGGGKELGLNTPARKDIAHAYTYHKGYVDNDPSKGFARVSPTWVNEVYTRHAKK